MSDPDERVEKRGTKIGCLLCPQTSQWGQGLTRKETVMEAWYSGPAISERWADMPKPIHLRQEGEVQGKA